MDLSTIISCILSIFASYLFCVWQMRKNKIAHYYITSYDIGKGFTSTFPDFSLRYKDKPLLKNVVVLAGRFENKGRNSLDSFNGKSDIKLILPEGCTILDIHLRTSDGDLKVEGHIDSQNLNEANFGIKSDYMLQDEFFVYHIIFETNKKINDLNEKLKFYQRIKNTNRFIKNNDIYKKTINRINYLNSLTTILLFFMTLSIMYMLIDFFPNFSRKQLVLFFMLFSFIFWMILVFIYTYLTKRLFIKRKNK